MACRDSPCPSLGGGGHGPPLRALNEALLRIALLLERRGSFEWCDSQEIARPVARAASGASALRAPLGPLARRAVDAGSGSTQIVFSGALGRSTASALAARS